jgi:shikimate kinase
MAIRNPGAPWATEIRNPNIVLAGFMGTGKTTVGRLLARRLGRPFVDTDALIEEGAGMTVAAIFAGEGEAAFRRLESEVCRRVASSGGQVVALGGGALLDGGNRATLESAGVLVLLTCRPDTLVERLTESARRGERPLLRDDVEDTIGRLLEAREPVYSTVRLRVDTTERTPEEVAEEVLNLYRHEIEPAMREVGR